jgi:hypothetical protein
MISSLNYADYQLGYYDITKTKTVLVQPGILPKLNIEESSS